MKPTVQQDQPEKTASYYRLHTDAVEELVSATKENTPRYSQEELEKYRSSRGKWHLPEMAKALLIKVWFYGAVCFFVFWGLGLYLADRLDLYFTAAVMLGMVTDLLINHFLRNIEKLPGGSQRLMMVKKRGVAGFFLNLMYGFLLLFGVMTIYNALNLLFQLILGPSAFVLGVEPILFGVFTTAVDTLYIRIKHLLQSIIADAMRK